MPGRREAAKGHTSAGAPVRVRIKKETGCPFSSKGEEHGFVFLASNLERPTQLCPLHEKAANRGPPAGQW